ncbi:hypothetical protein [Virgibacillus ndiopensis]
MVKGAGIAQDTFYLYFSSKFAAAIIVGVVELKALS